MGCPRTRRGPLDRALSGETPLVMVRNKLSEISQERDRCRMTSLLGMLGQGRVWDHRMSGTQ